MTINDWSIMTCDEKDAIIRPAWESGSSALEIAMMFSGATRNMIIGRVTQGKMGSHPTTRTKASYAGADKPPKPKPKVARKPIPAQPGTPPLVQRIPDDPETTPASVLHMINNERPPLAGAAPIPITALPNRPGVLCRFPVTGGYCGVACGDKMYCLNHHAVMYRQTEKLRMPKEARR